MRITQYYPSKVRRNRFGTSCDKCKKLLDAGTDCMRAQAGRNEFGCMMYDVYCIPCYHKVLPKKIEEERKLIKQESEALDELEYEVEHVFARQK